MRNGSKKILGFDGIRGLAVISVVFTHLHIFKKLVDKGTLTPEVVQSIDGAVGVQAFFVLSGFLITYLLIKEFNEKGSISLYNFYVRRSLRIFPLYFLVLFLIMLLHIIGEEVTNWKSLLLAALYSYNFVPTIWYSSIVGHTWSLAVEEHFYLIWPFLLISTAFKSITLLRILAVFIIISFILVNILTAWEWLGNMFFIERWSFIAGSNIAFGCAASILVTNCYRTPIFRKYLANKITLIVGICLWFNSMWLLDGSNYITPYLRGIGLAAVITWIYLNQNSILTKGLELSPIRYVGMVSYGVYMYQGFFLSTGPYRYPDQTWPPDQVIGLVLLVIVVPLSFHFFEKPIINLKSKYQRV